MNIPMAVGLLIPHARAGQNVQDKNQHAHIFNILTQNPKRANLMVVVRLDHVTLAIPMAAGSLLINHVVSVHLVNAVIPHVPILTIQW